RGRVYRIGANCQCADATVSGLAGCRLHEVRRSRSKPSKQSSGLFIVHLPRLVPFARILSPIRAIHFTTCPLFNVPRADFTLAGAPSNYHPLSTSLGRM